MQTKSVRFIENQLKELAKLIEVQMQSIPNTLTSNIGICPGYAAGIIS